MVPGGSKLSPGSSYTDMICSTDLFSYWAAMTVQKPRLAEKTDPGKKKRRRTRC